MANVRSKNIANANRAKIVSDSNLKMARRDTSSDQYRQSKLNASLFLENEEVIFHLVGNDHQRAFFIENYERQFKLYIIDTEDTSSATNTFSFKSWKLTLSEAREEFKKMGFYYLGYCEKINKVSSFIKNVTTKILPLQKIDLSINKELVTFFELNKADDCLSLFDSANAKQISSAKTKYDLWLEKWNEPLTDDFNNVKNEYARKVLQLLQHYAGKDNAEKILSFHWRRHHRNEIADVIGQFQNSSLLTSPRLIADLNDRIAARFQALPDDISKNNDEDIVYLGETLINLNDASSEDILFVLKAEINASKEPTIKTHGDLFALFDVFKDYIGVDYHALKKEPRNELENSI